MFWALLFTVQSGWLMCGLHGAAQVGAVDVRARVFAADGAGRWATRCDMRGMR